MNTTGVEARATCRWLSGDQPRFRPGSCQWFDRQCRPGPIGAGLGVEVASA